MDTSPDVAFAQQDRYHVIERGSLQAPNFDMPRMQRLGSNIVRQANYLIDTSISNLHESFPLKADNDVFNGDNLHLKEVLDYTDSVLDMPLSDSVTYNDHFRLAMTHDFAVESAAANAAFSSTAEEVLRKELVNGVAGKSIARMEEIIELYDQETSTTLKQELSGALAELLAVTLVNYRQNPNQIALPSSLEDDLNRRTDIYVYYIQEGIGHKVPVQVKNTLITRSPKNGFTLNSAALGRLYQFFPGVKMSSTKSFHLARILIKEMNGENLTNEDVKFTKKALDRFEANLFQELASRPGETL